MKKYSIVTDSSCDLSKAYRDKYNLKYAKMLLNWEDDKGEHEIEASLDWDIISPREFYDLARAGIRVRTSLIPMSSFIDLFEEYLKKGEDVLYIACSSGLSASFKIGQNAYAEIKDKYPNNRVVIVDSLRAGMSQGQIIMRAMELKEEGKSIDEVKEAIEGFRLKYQEIGIPETLSYLRRAGRVKAPAAFFGNIVGLKPILNFNEKGENLAIAKAIGRKKAYLMMAEMIRDTIEDPENQEIYLMSADCRDDDVNAFKEAILAQVKVKNIIVEPLGPIIGASSGPGTIIVNYRVK